MCDHQIQSLKSLKMVLNQRNHCGSHWLFANTDIGKLTFCLTSDHTDGFTKLSSLDTTDAPRYVVWISTESRSGQGSQKYSIQWNLGIRDTQGTVKNCPQF